MWRVLRNLRVRIQGATHTRTKRAEREKRERTERTEKREKREKREKERGGGREEKREEMGMKEKNERAITFGLMISRLGGAAEEDFLEGEVVGTAATTGDAAAFIGTTAGYATSAIFGFSHKKYKKRERQTERNRFTLFCGCGAAVGAV